MKRILLTIEYDGSCYSGWQKQPDKKTIQGEIENALYRILGKNIEVFGSGRTDAGVHALNQKAHFDIDVPIPISKLAFIIIICVYHRRCTHEKSVCVPNQPQSSNSIEVECTALE